MARAVNLDEPTKLKAHLDAGAVPDRPLHVHVVHDRIGNKIADRYVELGEPTELKACQGLKRWHSISLFVLSSRLRMALARLSS